MKIGKLPNAVLEKRILSHISKHRKEVVLGPKVGEDCALLDFGDSLCVISTDPITGATHQIGSLGVHVAANDIASNGVEPLGVMLTLLAPPGTTEEELEEIIMDADQAARSIQAEIMGGHTEITDGVNRILLSVTAIGRQSKGYRPLTGSSLPGDVVVMTKYAGLEGTAILANKHEEQLKQQIPDALIEEAKALSNQISVVKEGVLAGSLGIAGQMHDVTEGGIFGALWELAEAAGTGIEVYEDRIPLTEGTRAICEALKIDPYRLISSGVMAITVCPESADKLLAALKEAGIPAAVVGKILEQDRVILHQNQKRPLDPPDSDELYQI